ncbi:hypothetical protein Asera_11260 [Actinocatenispora sera]|uniref:Uncharacterized protein n=1 Tax=Actinocatenispora sera TaxID=390989 RepID=A0A810KYB1_9ACTN|nr:hypothetical protein Asera_11260 [Actinocatenispora sera]
MRAFGVSCDRRRSSARLSGLPSSRKKSVGPSGPAGRTVARPIPAPPTEADPTEADPTEAEPTEAEPTEAEPTEAEPTEADPVAPLPNALRRVAPPTEAEPVGGSVECRPPPPAECRPFGGSSSAPCRAGRPYAVPGSRGAEPVLPVGRAEPP